MQCVGRPVEQLNSQGLVVRRIDPEGEEKARLQKEAAAEKKKEVTVINTKYDQDKKRYIEATRGKR